MKIIFQTVRNLLQPDYGDSVKCVRRLRPESSRTLNLGVSVVLRLFAGTLVSLAASVANGGQPQFTELPSKPDSASRAAVRPDSSAMSSVGAKSAPAQPQAPTSPMDSLDGSHIIAIGDRLSFRIIEDEEDPKSLIVTDSGDLEVPYIGRFPAVGRTCRELSRALRKELEKDYYFQATVILAVDVMAKSRGKVYIVGPVRAPGPLEIPSDEVLTLSKAILRAGGFTDFADKKNVRVTRKSAGNSEQTFKVNVSTILDKGQTDNDLSLESGDLIVVPERAIRF